MKKLFMLFALVAFVGFSACESSDNNSGTKDPSTEDGGDEKGVLELKVDKQSISIDDSEVATFTVLLNGEDVTDDASIINITGGGYEELKSSQFTTLAPKIHTFFAIYKEFNSDQLAILATSENNISSTFYRRNIVMKFTATWCSYCPQMSSAINGAMALYPDRLIEVAVHSGDALVVNAGNDYNSAMGVEGLPSVAIDLDSKTTTTLRSATNIISNAEESMKENPTVAGLKMNTTMDGSKLKVDVESTVVEDNEYKIVVLVLQNGFNYDQAGTTDANYRQNHVLRVALTSPFGDSLGDLVVNEIVRKSYELDLTDVDTETVEVVAFMLNNVGDARFLVNNAVSCGVSESVDYQFEPIVEE